MAGIAGKFLAQLKCISAVCNDHFNAKMARV
jgi:hypothetical protein